MIVLRCFLKYFYKKNLNNKNIILNKKKYIYNLPIQNAMPSGGEIQQDESFFFVGILIIISKDWYIPLHDQWK